MNSEKGFNFLKSLNINVDFCYIDALHSYEGIKLDYNSFKSILVNRNNYNGLICGDDYEITLEEIMNETGKNMETTKNDLREYSECEFIVLKKSDTGFHPGITLFFNEIEDDIKKYQSGFWVKN